MTMTRPLANPRRATLVNYSLQLLLALAAAFGYDVMVVSAQTRPPAPQQQRPRRVGSATARPTPTPQAATKAETQAGEEVEEGDVVRVETQLVSVPAVVTDRTGRPIVNLRAENFVLYEDGRPQQISIF